MEVWEVYAMTAKKKKATAKKATHHARAKLLATSRADVWKHKAQAAKQG